MPALDPQSLPRHLDRLYRAAWALCGSPHDAEDLVQETCARVLARPRRLHGEDELAYLMTVLRNTFLTHLRTTARRPRIGHAPVEELDPIDPRTGTRPEAALEAREVIATIAGLPERYRLALVAVDVVGLSYREAGTVLETREATIATRVFRARQLLARRLAGDEQPLQPAAEGASPGPAAGNAASVARDVGTTAPVAGDAAPVTGDTAPVAGDAAPVTGDAAPVAGDVGTGSPASPSASSGPAPAARSARDDGTPAPGGTAPREGRPAPRRLTHRGHR